MGQDSGASVPYLAATGAGRSQVPDQQVGGGQHEQQHGEQAQQQRAPDPPQILAEVDPGALADAGSRSLRADLHHALYGSSAGLVLRGSRAPPNLLWRLACMETPIK